MKKKTILTSILSLIMCFSLITGATFALFTSESNTNIAITSGKVEVVATIENLAVHSPTAIAQDGTIKDDTNAAANGVFANGGTAEIVGSTLTLDRMTPGDKVTFDIRVKNNSTVAIKYRTLLLVGANDGLFEGLNVTVNGTAFTMTQQSAWANMEVGAADIVIPVEVVLPSNAGNEYQEKSAELNFTVSAVQGNATTTNPDVNTTYLYTASDLVAFAKSVNAGNTYKDQTVVLADNINMAGVEYVPAGNVTSFPGVTFKGTFDGNGKTISNLVVSDNTATYASAGLFGSISGTVKNVTIDSATVTSTHYAGGIVGYSYGTVEACTVKNSTITSNFEVVNGSFDNGDKAGGIVGYLAKEGTTGTVTGCSVANTTVKGYRDLGGIVGLANTSDSGEESVVTNNKLLEDVKIVVSKLPNYKNYATEAEHDANSIVGDADTTQVSNNTGEATISYVNEVYINNANELKALVAQMNGGSDYAGAIVYLTADIDLANEAWTPISSFAGTFDGQGHTISNMTANLFGTVSGTVKNLNVENVNILNTTKGGANGFIGTVATGGLVDECNVSGVDIRWADGIGDMTDGFGGVVKTVSAGATVQNCEFTDIAVTTYAKTKRTGGVFDGISGTVKDCVISNVNFTVADNYSGDAWTTEYAGGLAAVVSGGAVVEGCTINNMTVFADEAFNFGGLFGKAYVSGQSGDITLKGINVNGLMMTVGNTVVDYGTYRNVGGFIGQVDSRSNAMSLNVDGCKITGLDMTLASIEVTESPAAGFISCINGNAKITNCSVAGEIDGTNAAFAIGGFLGDIGGHGCPADGYTVNINDCKADVAITGNDNIFVGGFVGYAGSYRKTIALTLNFNNCEATGSFYGQIETGTTETTTFTNCKVDGVAFNG